MLQSVGVGPTCGQLDLSNGRGQEGEGVNAERRPLAKLDLKDANLSISLNPLASRILAFCFRSAFWHWKVLPFGLSTAPRIFTKDPSAGLASLRAWKVPFVQYLDDILVFGNPP
jgi:hypothetical protein